MKAFIISLLFVLSPQAQAAPFAVTPAGDDGGYRLTGSCRLSGQEGDCPFDTGAPFSVVGLNDRNRDLPSLKEVDIHSIGLVLRCSLVKVPDFQMFEMSSPDQIFYRCGNLPSVTSLIGMDFFAHHTFAFDFRKNEILFDRPFLMETQKLLWNEESAKLVVPAQIDHETVRMAVDTGAPVTFMDQKLIDAHPSLFVESARAPSEMMKRRGLRRFEMHGPAVVGGISLEAQYVYGADVTGFSKGEYSVLLGVNHMRNASWYFDLPGKKWAIYR